MYECDGFTWHSIAAPISGSAPLCQGLHKVSFMPYGSRVERSAESVIKALRLLCLCWTAGGRMNAGNADHAVAWLQETDRLETAWNRGERCDSRLRDYD